MKNRLQRRAATRIAKLNADLDAGNKQEFKLRQDLETAKAKYEKLQAKKKVRLEASVKSELGEAEEQVRRARDTFDQAGIATETAMTTANASRQEPRSLRAKRVLTSILQSAEAREKEDRLVAANAKDAEDLAYKQLDEADARAFALERSLRQHSPDSKSK